jgi:putative membrane protein
MDQTPPPAERRAHEPGGRRAYDESADALRRTRLANERTYLAWWRTGLTALAVSLAAGKVVPTLRPHTTRWPYAVVGAGYAVLGVLCIGYGLRRERDIDTALREGRFRSMSDRYTTALTAFGIVLGLVTLLLILSSE